MTTQQLINEFLQSHKGMIDRHIAAPSFARLVLLSELTESPELSPIFHESEGEPIDAKPEQMARWFIRKWQYPYIFYAFDIDHVRVCDHCGRPMCWGYLMDTEYYCSDTCLAHHYTDDQLADLFADPESNCYFTSWID